MGGMSSARAAGLQRREWLGVLGLSLGLLAVINVPYALAYAADGQHEFTGILVNTQDGFSYLSKLRQGWRGEWLFSLPYTAKPGPGVTLYTYHLLLGHLARWLALPTDVAYHLARLLASLALLLTAYRFVAIWFSTPRRRLAVWLFFALGSGLGWLAVPGGAFTADLWVAESIPFLSMFSNAHFPLAWVLLLWIFMWTLPGLAAGPSAGRRALLTAISTTLLAQVQPMTLLPALATVAGTAAWQTAAGWPASADRRRLLIQTAWPPLIVGLASAPWVLYALWITQTHPQLRSWNAQNITLSPWLGEALLWGGLPVLLAPAGIVVALRRRRPIDLSLLIWLGLGLGLLYAPFAFQRRMSLGLWMPLCLLAALGFFDLLLPRLAARWRPLPLALIAVFGLPSTLLVFAATLGGVTAREPALFLSAGEAEALRWLSSRGHVVALASPEFSLFIPARTDARVVYGHPMETVDAPTQKRRVLAAYSGALGEGEAGPDVDLIFCGPREQALGPCPRPAGWQTVFERGGVQVYAP